jgi:hypothetical protein
LEKPSQTVHENKNHALIWRTTRITLPICAACSSLPEKAVYDFSNSSLKKQIFLEKHNLGLSSFEEMPYIHKPSFGYQIKVRLLAVARIDT